jgi:hypothetical protein
VFLARDGERDLLLTSLILLLEKPEKDTTETTKEMERELFSHPFSTKRRKGG